MKNRKGAIATLLTLGLVVIGSLITLGTSLFVSNKKTNLASNSMAASNCQRMYCANGMKNSDGKNYFYKRPNGSFYASGDTNCAWGEIRADSVCTISAIEVPAVGIDCGMNIELARKKCSIGITTDGCKSGTAKCRKTSEEEDIKAGTEGGECINNDQDVNYCSSSNLECNKKGICVRKQEDEEPVATNGDDSCWLLKCIGGKAQKVMYSDSLSKYDMPLTRCQGGSPYSGGGWMILGRAEADKQVKTFDCTEDNVEMTVAPTPDAPDEEVPKGCTGIAVKGRITSTQKTSCTSEGNNEIKYINGKYWCCPKETTTVPEVSTSPAALITLKKVSCKDVCANLGWFGYRYSSGGDVYKDDDGKYYEDSQKEKSIETVSIYCTCASSNKEKEKYNLVDSSKNISKDIVGYKTNPEYDASQTDWQDNNNYKATTCETIDYGNNKGKLLDKCDVCSRSKFRNMCVLSKSANWEYTYKVSCCANFY